MLLPSCSRQRQGTTLVEFAVVSGATMFLIFALVVGGLGVFRYEEVAHLAREGARYASTHAGQYQQDGTAQQTGASSITTSDDLRNYLLSKTVLLDPALLDISVSWSSPSGTSPVNMPNYLDTTAGQTPPGQVTIQNYVTVTVTYKWTPELYLVGPITLTSTSKLAVSY
ncbi:MAG TPA: TadE/TadG family type IV pilus assembly protein [Gemmataceae bacterium]|nr:TadE/TadG family type IV pilus assembly protein [Gemmataceae bacterium]